MAGLRRRAKRRTEQPEPVTVEADVAEAIVDALTAGGHAALDIDRRVAALAGSLTPVATSAHTYAFTSGGSGAESRSLSARVLADADAIRREAAMLRHLQEVGYPVPEVVVEVATGRLAVLVTSAPTTLTMIEAMGKHMTAIPQFVAAFGVAHAELHAVAIEGIDAIVRTVPSPLDALRAAAAVGNVAADLVDELAWLDAHAADGAPEAEVVCHGDYNPVTVHVTPPAAEPTDVTSWGHSRLAEPSFDVARTMATLWAAPYFAEKFAERTMVKMLRDSLVEAYRNAYDRAAVTPLDPERLRYWEAYQMVMLAALARRKIVGAVHGPWDPAQPLSDTESAFADARERFADLIVTH